MSSDVYIDCFAPFAMASSSAYSAVTVRIGHLGQLCYFGKNAIDFLELLQLAEPIMDDRLARTIGSVLDKMVENWAAVRQDHEYSGYVKEPADILPGSDFVRATRTASGCRWRVRTD